MDLLEEQEIRDSEIKEILVKGLLTPSVSIQREICWVVKSFNCLRCLKIDLAGS